MVEPSFPVSVPSPHKRCSWLQLRQAAGMWVSRLSAEVFLARQTPQSPRILSAPSPQPGEAHQVQPPLHRAPGCHWTRWQSAGRVAAQGASNAMEPVAMLLQTGPS